MQREKHVLQALQSGALEHAPGGESEDAPSDPQANAATQAAKRRNQPRMVLMSRAPRPTASA